MTSPHLPVLPQSPTFIGPFLALAFENRTKTGIKELPNQEKDSYATLINVLIQANKPKPAFEKPLEILDSRNWV